MTPTQTPDCNRDARASFAGPTGSAYPRDFSFYMRSHGGSAGRYHFLGDDLASKCGKVRMLDTDSPMDTDSVPNSLRCKANGCKELWPNVELSDSRPKQPTT